jgi:large subunit ribosomal protein L5e
LVARRLLTQLGMDKLYTGVESVDGQDYDVSANPNESRRPFMALLDIGIRRPTIGNRVFAVMKGASDGGLYVPHSMKKFPGFEKLEDKKTTYSAEVHRDRIFGCHVDEYMEKFEETETNKQFKKWKAVLKENGVQSVEEMFEKVHEAIRKNPVRAKKTKKIHKKPARNGNVLTTEGGASYRRDKRKTHAERKADVEKKITLAKQMLGEA